MEMLVKNNKTYTYKDLKKLLAGKSQDRDYAPNKRNFSIIRGSSFGIHHGGPKYIQKLMGIAPDDNILDDIPCVAMSLDDHNAFHSILNKYIPEKPGPNRDDLLTYLNGLPERQKREYYVNAMEKAYDDFASTLTDDSFPYDTFMEQVEAKLRTKVNISEGEVSKVVEQFIKE